MIGRILPVVLILISIGLFVGYINPTYTTEVLPLQARIKEYDSTLAAAADFNKKEAELASDRSAIPADGISRLSAYLPDGVDNVQLILDLNALAAHSGVQLSDFDIKDNAPQTTLGEDTSSLPLDSGASPTDSLDLTVKATGSYAAFRTFLDGIEKSLRPMDLVQVVVSNSQTGVYSYAMTLRIYWLH